MERFKFYGRLNAKLLNININYISVGMYNLKCCHFQGLSN